MSLDVQDPPVPLTELLKQSMSPSVVVPHMQFGFPKQVGTGGLSQTPLKEEVQIWTQVPLWQVPG